jgi:hypothetical protein
MDSLTSSTCCCVSSSLFIVFSKVSAIWKNMFTEYLIVICLGRPYSDKPLLLFAVVLLSATYTGHVCSSKVDIVRGGHSTLIILTWSWEISRISCVYTSSALSLFAFKCSSSVLKILTSPSCSLRSFFIASSAFMYLEIKGQCLYWRW